MSPVPSDSLHYVPAMFVKAVLTQTQEEVSESICVQFHDKLCHATTCTQVLLDRDVFRALVTRWRKTGGMGGPHCPPASESGQQG